MGNALPLEMQVVLPVFYTVGALTCSSAWSARLAASGPGFTGAAFICARFTTHCRTWLLSRSTPTCFGRRRRTAACGSLICACRECLPACGLSCLPCS